MKTFFSVFYKSFFDAKTYRFIVEEWSGIGIRFMLVLALCMSLVNWLQADELRLIIHRLPEIAKQMPLLTHDEDVIEIEGKAPHYIYLNDKAPLFAAIDTRYSDYGIEQLGEWMSKNQVRLVITSTRIVWVGPKGGRPLTLSLRFLSTRAKTITPEQWNAAAAWLQPKAALLFIAIDYVYNFLYLLANAFIWALLAKFIVQTMGMLLDFSALMRITAVTSMPVWILTEVFHSGGSSGLFAVLSARISYMILGIRANR